MEVPPNRPLYTLIVNSVNAELHMLKYVVMGQSSNTSPTVVDRGGACQQ